MIIYDKIDAKGILGGKDMFKVFKKLSLLIVLVFVLIFIVSNAIIDVSYYTYFEHMMADKLSQSVEVASSSYTQSFFDTIKREAVKLVTEEPLKNFLDGSNAPEDTQEFLTYRTDVSVSEYIEVYSAQRDEAVFYDEQGDYFGTRNGSAEVDFLKSDRVFSSVAIPNAQGEIDPNNPFQYRTLIYQKISEDGSYIASGLCAHVTRVSILSGLILPKNISYTDIRNGTVTNTGSNMYLVNSDGVILSDYFLQSTGKSLKDYDLDAQFKNSPFDEENKYFDYNEPSRLVSCGYQPKPGLYIVGVIQKQDIISAILPTLLIIGISIFVVLAIFCTLCLLILYRAFSPYEKLVKKVSETSNSQLDGAQLLDEAIQKGLKAKQKAYEMAISDYILDIETDVDTITELEQCYIGSYTPVICQIDNYNRISYHTKATHKCREVIESIFGLIGKTLCVHLDKNKLFFILCGDTTTIALKEVLTDCQNALKNSEINTSYIIGQTQTQLKDIKDSYDEMQKNMFMSICYGPGSILTEIQEVDPVEFPTNTISALIGSINTCDTEKVTKLLNQIFEDFQGKVSPLIPIYLLQIALNVISHITSFDSNQTLFDYQDILNKITEASSLSDARTVLSQLCFDACSYLVSFQNKSKSKQDIEQKMIDYLNENYSNPNLSLTYISNIFGYSPKYLGRIFKNYTNTFFTQYLTTLRMEKARDLILNTDLPIADIFESVGVTTLQHFYRLFKKQFGNSPAAMRKNKPKE